MITNEQFKQLFPYCDCVEALITALNVLLPKYEINTPNRISGFLAQCGHESGGWRVFSENLNYGEKGLNTTFPKYFKNAGRNAAEYVRKPEKIANVVYANRMGNDDIASGDGWRYRGRGPIQLTGKANYEAFANEMCMNVLKNPDLVATDKNVAIMSAIWFWNKNKLNRFADSKDLKGMTKTINGGYNGLEDRISCYNSTIKVFGDDVCTFSDNADLDDDSIDEENDTFMVLRRGSRGDGVKEIQKELGLNPDGIFGIGTEKALKKWQATNKLAVDGIAGPKTLDLLLK